MKDVADLVGVSKQTVSAVINEKPGITPETQERVRAIIKQLDYRPHSVARSLATGRTHTIAFLASDLSAPFIGKLALAAEDAAHACGYNLVVYNTHDDVGKEVAYFRDAAERGVDGILFVSATDRHSGCEMLQETGTPAVALDRVPDPYDGPTVTLDNVKAGRLAAEHLVELGHRRVAHISGPQTVLISRDRLKGFRQALESGGLVSGLQIEAASSWDYRPGFDAMQRLLERDSRPTAVFAAGDALAIGAMRAIFAAGLHVPGDISVVGVDDIDSAAFQNPPLTTIRQSITELATLALQLLCDILRGKELQETHIVMDPVLVRRESTAPPAIG